MMQEAWFVGFKALVSVGGGAKGELTKFSGGVARVEFFDINKQNDAVTSE